MSDAVQPTDSAEHVIILFRDATREVRLTGLKHRKALLISELHLIEGAWIERQSHEVSLGFLVFTLDFTRSDFVTALQRDSSTYGFSMARRDWGRAAGGIS